MRTGGGEAGALIELQAGFQRLGQRSGGCGTVGELYLLGSTGDSPVVMVDVRMQPHEELLPESHEEFPVLRKQGCVALQRSFAPAWMAEQGVAVFEGFAVGLQGLAVGRVPLAAEKVEVFAAFFCRAAHEAHIAVGQPGHGGGIGQIVAVVAALGSIHLHAELALAPEQSASAFFCFQGDAESPAALECQLVEFAGTGTVQGERKTECLHEAGLALRVGPEQHGTLCRYLPAEGAVTAEIAQTQGVEHIKAVAGGQASIGSARMASIIFLPILRWASRPLAFSSSGVN